MTFHPRPTLRNLLRSLAAAVTAAACTEPSEQVVRIDVTPARAEVGQADTVQLTATLYDEAGNELMGSVRWSSRDTAIATVDQAGRVVGVRTGLTVVQAAADNRAGAGAVSVTPGSTTGGGAEGDTLVIDIPRLTLIPQESSQLGALFLSAGGADTTIASVAWSTDDERVVSVSAGGVVTGVGPGTATVFATPESGSETASMIASVAPPFASISAGVLHTCGVTATGEAYCWGNGTFGKLGNGLVDNQEVPSAVLLGGTVTLASIGTGTNHTCGLAIDGSAYCWGGNAQGQLGIGSADAADHVVRQVVAGGLDLASLSVGADHTCAATAGSVTYCWGDGRGGQLRSLGRLGQTIPTALGQSVGAVAAGGGHSCGLDGSGQAVCWGSNDVGQAGTDVVTGFLGPLRIGTPDASGFYPFIEGVWASSSTNAYAVAGQRVFGSPCIGFGPVPLALRQATFAETEPNGTPGTANAVALGDTVTGTIDPAGDWDYFSFTAGQGDTLDIDVAAETLTPSSPLDAVLYLFNSAGDTLAINDDDGETLDSRIRYVVNATDTYTVALTEFETANGGQGGGLSYVYDLRFVRAPLPACSPTVWRGDGTGATPVLGTSASLLDIHGTDANNVVAVGYDAPSREGTMLRFDGAVWSAFPTGFNCDVSDVWAVSATEVYAIDFCSGILEWNGATWTRVQLDPRYFFHDIWADSPASAWVIGFDGGAGTGVAFKREALGSWPLAQSGLPSLNALWGSDASNIFALGGADDGAGVFWRYDGTTWGEHTNFGVGPGFGIISGTSATNVLAVGVEGGQFRLFGLAGDEWIRLGGQSAPDFFEAMIAITPDTAIFVGANGSVYGFASGAPAPVGGGRTFTRLAAGALHTCGLVADGSAYCWGAPGGRLGTGSTDGSTSPLPVAGGRQFANLSAGGSHTCAVTIDDALYCWGANGAGQLGDGTTTTRTTPVLVDLGEPVAAGGAGANHTCAVTVRGVAFCWGVNGAGQLGAGTGDLTNNPVPTRVAGPI